MEYDVNRAKPLGPVAATGVRGYWGKYMVGNHGKIRTRTAPTFDTPEQANESLIKFCERY